MLDRETRAEINAYAKLLRSCSKIDPNLEKNLKDGENFANLSQEISDKIGEFKNQISKIPLTAFILLWADHYKSIENFNSQSIEMMNDLIEKEIIPLKSPNHFLSLFDLSEKSDIGHYVIIDSIRCYKEWSIEKKESYVSFYMNFIEWLSNVTLGYIPKASDMDRMLSKGRLLKFETYIKIINGLSLRDRILAKICYLGGSRPLEEIFSLKIEDIDFEKWILKLSENHVMYPENVLVDLKEYIGTRKEGYVFINREGKPIDLTVPYRALKTVTKKLDLDKSFTFKDFMKSV